MSSQSKHSKYYCDSHARTLKYTSAYFVTIFLRGTGLPDGIFSKQKSKFGYILEDLLIENVGVFYGHLLHFTIIWYMYYVSFRILCVISYIMCHFVCYVSFGIICVIWYILCHLVCYVSFGIICVIWYILCPLVYFVSFGMLCVLWYILCIWYILCHLVYFVSFGSSVNPDAEAHSLCPNYVFNFHGKFGNTALERTSSVPSASAF
jgi:hypothetical protein